MNGFEVIASGAFDIHSSDASRAKSVHPVVGEFPLA